MDGVEIRRATVDDVEAIEENHHRCFLDTYAVELAAGDLTAPDRASTRAQMRAWFDEGAGFEADVAPVDENIAAHVTTLGRHLVHLFIDPEHQGLGLGRFLLAHAESSIAARGPHEMELHTRTDNHRAVAFYRRSGWTMTDRVLRTVEHGIEYDEHVLVKRSPSTGRAGLRSGA